MHSTQAARKRFGDILSHLPTNQKENTQNKF